MFQPLQQPRKTSFWTLAFIGILLGLGLFGLWYFHIEPIYTALTPIVEGVKGIGQTWIPQIQTFLSQLSTQTIATVGVVGGTAIVGKLWKSHVDNQKAQLEAQAQQALTDNMKLSQAYTQLEQQKAALEQQLKTAQTFDSQNLLDESQAIISQKTEEVKKLQGQVEILTRIGSPSEAEMVDKLKQMGYEVIKKIVVK
jgi:hypothetical protein